MSTNMTVKEISDHLKAEILQSIIDRLGYYDPSFQLTYGELMNLLIDIKEKI